MKCHITEGESRPIPFKNGLSVRFGSDDSGTPKPSAERIFGYTADKMIGTSIMRLTPRNRPGNPSSTLD